MNGIPGVVKLRMTNAAWKEPISLVDTLWWKIKSSGRATKRRCLPGMANKVRVDLFMDQPTNPQRCPIMLTRMVQHATGYCHPQGSSREETQATPFPCTWFQKATSQFRCSQKYWDLYDREKIKLYQQSGAPIAGAATGLHASFELRTRHGIPKKGPIGPELAQTLLHGYYACVSYVDAQIGLMLEALEEAGVRDNTVIVVCGDHGWHLGDMGIWGKATNYEIATRVPLIVWTSNMQARGSTPSVSGTRGHLSHFMRTYESASSGISRARALVPSG